LAQVKTFLYLFCNHLQAHLPKQMAISKAFFVLLLGLAPVAGAVLVPEGSTGPGLMRHESDLALEQEKVDLEAEVSMSLKLPELDPKAELRDKCDPCDAACLTADNIALFDSCDEDRNDRINNTEIQKCLYHGVNVPHGVTYPLEKVSLLTDADSMAFIKEHDKDGDAELTRGEFAGTKRGDCPSLSEEEGSSTDLIDQTNQDGVTADCDLKWITFQCGFKNVNKCSLLEDEEKEEQEGGKASERQEDEQAGRRRRRWQRRRRRRWVFDKYKGCVWQVIKEVVTCTKWGFPSFNNCWAWFKADGVLGKWKDEFPNCNGRENCKYKIEHFEFKGVVKQSYLDGKYIGNGIKGVAGQAKISAEKWFRGVNDDILDKYFQRYTENSKGPGAGAGGMDDDGEVDVGHYGAGTEKDPYGNPWHNDLLETDNRAPMQFDLFGAMEGHFADSDDDGNLASVIATVAVAFTDLGTDDGLLDWEHDMDRLTSTWCVKDAGEKGLMYWSPTDCGIFAAVHECTQHIGGVPDKNKDKAKQGKRKDTVKDKVKKCMKMKGPMGVPTPFLNMKWIDWCVPNIFKIFFNMLVDVFGTIYNALAVGANAGPYEDEYNLLETEGNFQGNLPTRRRGPGTWKFENAGSGRRRRRRRRKGVSDAQPFHTGEGNPVPCDQDSKWTGAKGNDLCFLSRGVAKVGSDMADKFVGDMNGQIDSRQHSLFEDVTGLIGDRVHGNESTYTGLAGSCSGTDFAVYLMLKFAVDAGIQIWGGWGQHRYKWGVKFKVGCKNNNFQWDILWHMSLDLVLPPSFSPDDHLGGVASSWWFVVDLGFDVVSRTNIENIWQWFAGFAIFVEIVWSVKCNPGAVLFVIFAGAGTRFEWPKGFAIAATFSPNGDIDNSRAGQGTALARSRGSPGGASKAGRNARGRKTTRPAKPVPAQVKNGANFKNGRLRSHGGRGWRMAEIDESPVSKQVLQPLEQMADQSLPRRKIRSLFEEGAHAMAGTRRTKAWRLRQISFMSRAGLDICLTCIDNYMNRQKKQKDPNCSGNCGDQPPAQDLPEPGDDDQSYLTDGSWEEGSNTVESGGPGWLTLGGTTAVVSQISTGPWSNPNPWKAIDGNDNGHFGAGSCTHTYRHGNAWWRLDFKRQMKVEKIKVKNRGDCCGSRLSPFKVHFDWHLRANNVYINQNENKEVAINWTGQLMQIATVKYDYLTLCEVAVFGERA